jgi:putative hemin transport protein
LFYHSWKYGFAVYEKKGHEVQKSLQFFDISGTAIHKIFLNDKSNHSEFIKIVDKFRWIGEAELETKLAASQKQDFPDSEIDRVSFLKEWSELQDTHDFFGLTRKFKVSRTQSLRLAEGSFTTKVDSGLVKKMLEEVSKSGLEIMVFVGNHGMIQIHTGKVSNFKILENWVNIMDPEFNLHLREDLIENVWIVRKPTKDGDVHSMEVFDKDGEMIVQFFGKRKPGIPENKDWKALLEAIQ